MQPVEGEELERMKHYLSIYQQSQPHNGDDVQLDVEFVDGNVASKSSLIQHADTHNTGKSTLVVENEQDKNVDWSKVGKVYKPTDNIESILEKEMARLKIVMDKKIAAQDIELEEKALIARGKKKW